MITRLSHHRATLNTVCQRYGLKLRFLPPATYIPGSYWGAPEAGLVNDRLFARADTPLHSALHEACHFICMSPQRRRWLCTDAGGDTTEENAVCYLQICLATTFPGLAKTQLMRDMDHWGYSFRLGSAMLWFHHDAEDARRWLLSRGMIDTANRPTGQRRNDAD